MPTHTPFLVSDFWSTTALTNSSRTNRCHFDPPECLSQIHSTSGNHWAYLDRGFQFSFLWKGFSLHRPIPLKDSIHCEAMGDNGSICIKFSFTPSQVLQVDIAIQAQYIPWKYRATTDIGMEDRGSTWKVFLKDQEKVKSGVFF